MQCWIGIDVSKLTLDACLLREAGKPQTKQFKNEEAGWAKLLRWASSFECADMHFCMESTGTYGNACAHLLVAEGQKVSVENPAWIKHFGISKGVLNKTDRADARLIAEYARCMNPAPWRMSTPEMQLLISLLQRVSSLTELMVQEKNRLSVPGQPEQVKVSLKQTIEFIEQQIAQIEEQIRSHVDKHPDIKKDQELLESIPGIGEGTALRILAEIGDVDQFESAQAVAAYAGLSPRKHESGSSVRQATRISRAGSKRLRTAMYMPAMTAIRYNPLVRALYQRLIERGLSRMAALAAAMRKLLMLAYGVLKTRQKFNAEFAKSSS